jgi:DNA-binding response OmpR family regulator
MNETLPRAGKRILIAEDNEDLRAFIKLALEQAGYEVELAGDGRRALALQRGRGADVLITDLFMPERDGFETIDCFRREFPSVKIIAMSGGGDLSKKHDYLSTAGLLGVDAVLRKPFELDELLKTVESLG